MNEPAASRPGRDGAAGRERAILAAVALAAERLLADPLSRPLLGEVLGPLAEASGASRVYLFENHRASGGDLLMSQRWEWVGPGISAQIDNPELQSLSWEASGMGSWRRRLAEGEAVVARVRELEPELRALMEAQQIRALLLVPVRLQGEWWGFLGFDDCRAEHDWLPEEVAALRAAAGLLGAAMHRQQIEQALRASEEATRELLENASDIVWTLDREGRIASLNRAGEVALGAAREELVGRPLAESVSAESAAALGEHLADTLVDLPRRSPCELAMRTRQGRPIRLELSSRPLRRAGRAVGVQTIARDVGERRLLQQQLQQAQKMEAVGRLAGGVAHDFGNLLTAINGYAELLLRRLAPGAEMRREIEEIFQAGQRAASLTRQLLTFSRQQPSAPRPIDLNAIVLGMESLLSRLIGEDIALATALAPGLGAVLADQGQVEQILLNLVVNARDAMPRGGHLRISTARVDPETVPERATPVPAAPGFSCLEVTDDGCGMDRETLARIFEPFFTTKEPGRGTGLGLATVYGIVRQFGGQVVAESEPGRGTRIAVLLPHAAELAARPEPDRQGPEPGRAGGTILLVEDDAAVRSFAARILRDAGHRVLEAEAAAEAVAAFEVGRGEIELLLTDVVLPGESGVVLAERLLRRRPELPVLFISGHSASLVEGHGLAAVGSDILAKPFAGEELTARVRAAMSRRAGPPPQVTDG